MSVTLKCETWSELENAVAKAIANFKVEYVDAPELSYEQFVKESGYNLRNKQISIWGNYEGKYESFAIMYCFCGHAQKTETYYSDRQCPKCGSEYSYYLNSDGIVHSYYKFEPLSETAFNITRFDLNYAVEGDWKDHKITLEVMKRGTLHFDLTKKVNRMEILRNSGKVERTKKFSQLAKYLLHNMYGHTENKLTLDDISKVDHVANRTGLLEYFEYKAKSYNKELKEFSVFDILEFLEYRQDNPQVELLVKSGKFSLANEALHGKINLAEKFGNETKARKFFKLPRPIQAHLTDLRMDQVKALERMYEKSRGFSVDSLNYLCRHYLIGTHNLTTVEQLVDYGYRLDDLVNYLNRADLYQAIQPNETITLLRDYVRMATLTEIPYKKYSTNLKKDHDLMVREYKFVEDQMRTKLYEAEKDKNRHLEYENKEFVIMLPETLNDIVREGKELSHCVASYINSVTEGLTVILFCREKEDVTKPFYTIEVRQGVVVQVKGFGNRAINSNSLKTFIKNWKKAKRLM